MGIKIAKGNMYSFVTHVWNPIKGKCPHDCTYCYMKRWGEQPELHLDLREMTANLGTGNTIFVGSGTDMWAEGVERDWIIRVMMRCFGFLGNRYLFQSKNPSDFIKYLQLGFNFPRETIFATTIESNHFYEQMGNAPSIPERVAAMKTLSDNWYTTMITIEPIMDFDLPVLVEMLETANPNQVNIGADSLRNNLPEPSAEKVQELIDSLRKFTKVHLKKNLSRLWGNTQ